MLTNPLEFLQKLTDAGLEFVIVGGVALRLWGGTRLTHDIDVVPCTEPTDWSKVVDVVWAAGGRPRIPETREAIQDWRNIKRWQQEKGMFAISFRSRDLTAEIDFLIGDKAEYEGLRHRATCIEVGGYKYYVASIDDLITMKQKAGRPQDLLDIEELKSIKKRLQK